ncbi:MAG: two-component sensor histidine kinase [Saccharothrix sp.]|nr:two-component sensor histidine kinase [Saccharothrix sp.]
MSRVPLADVALGGGLAVLVLGSSVLEVGPPGPAGSTGWAAVGLAVVLAAALAVRRRLPASTLVAVNAVTALWFALDYHGRLVTASALIGCYTLAAHRGWKAGVVGGVATAVVTVLTVRFTLGGQWFSDQVLNAIPLEAAATALGAAVFSHRAFAAGARERAERIAQARSEQAKAQAAEERLVIARELHDVFGHTMAAISVQAGVAVHVMERRPEQVVESLNAIKRISDDGLAEVRVLLGVMRSDEPRTLTASGGLKHLDKLLDVPGVSVELKTTGTRPLPLAVDLAAFRIIQESLTNVRRHANATRVHLELTYRATDLEVVIRDNGTGAGTGNGHGIEGMKARAQALGGTLTAGPADGGFEVRCTLPAKGDE